MIGLIVSDQGIYPCFLSTLKGFNNTFSGIIGSHFRIALTILMAESGERIGTEY
jgi:hypothetical protein